MGFEFLIKLDKTSLIEILHCGDLLKILIMSFYSKIVKIRTRTQDMPKVKFGHPGAYKGHRSEVTRSDIRLSLVVN